MGNTISNKDKDIKMSNGLTSVLINVLGLSGSIIAESDDEIKIILWIMEANIQSIFGIGTVGFDIGDIPWNRVKFNEEKEFILKTIDGAKNKIGWETLGYKPNETMLMPVLDKLQNMIYEFEVDQIKSNSARYEIEIPVQLRKCNIHNTFITKYGCQCCID